jgi:hypothetical protein
MVMKSISLFFLQLLLCCLQVSVFGKKTTHPNSAREVPHGLNWLSRLTIPIHTIASYDSESVTLHMEEQDVFRLFAWDIHWWREWLAEEPVITNEDMGESCVGSIAFFFF